MELQKYYQADNILKDADDYEYLIAWLSDDERKPYLRHIGVRCVDIWEAYAEKAIEHAVCKLIVRLMDLSDKLDRV